jgi:excisionase family DNA binding protein
VNQEQDGAFLSASEVGQRIGRGDDTVRRMWDAGTLPFVELNGRRVTPRAALDKWINDLADTAMGNVRTPE